MLLKLLFLCHWLNQRNSFFIYEQRNTRCPWPSLKGQIQFNCNGIHIRGLHLRPTGSLPFLPVDGDGQQAAHRRHDGDANHGVKHVVQLPDEVIFRYQLLVVKEVNDDGLRGVGHAHQHVRHRQTATSKPASVLLNLSLFVSSSFLLSPYFNLSLFLDQSSAFSFTGSVWVCYASCLGLLFRCSCPIMLGNKLCFIDLYDCCTIHPFFF